MTDPQIEAEKAAKLRQLLLFSPKFLEMLGAFHATWSTAEQTVDYTIGHFLSISHEQTHLLTSGMMFGRKAQLLAGLIARSKHEKKSELMAALNVLRGEGKRDWLTHAYLSSSANKVTFMHRNVGGEYKTKPLTFGAHEFALHCQKIGQAGTKMQEAIGLNEAKLLDFFDAAVRAESKA
jgi:hypothetical protein